QSRSVCERRMTMAYSPSDNRLALFEYQGNTLIHFKGQQLIRTGGAFHLRPRLPFDCTTLNERVQSTLEQTRLFLESLLHQHSIFQAQLIGRCLQVERLLIACLQLRHILQQVRFQLTGSTKDLKQRRSEERRVGK